MRVARSLIVEVSWNRLASLPVLRRSFHVRDCSDASMGVQEGQGEPDGGGGTDCGAGFASGAGVFSSPGEKISAGNVRVFLSTSKASCPSPVRPAPTDFNGRLMTCGSFKEPFTSKNAVVNPLRSPASNRPNRGMLCSSLV